ncbi:MAG: hypothetical protein WBA57_14275 [Elainellaceae cyanobacterium]
MANSNDAEQAIAPSVHFSMYRSDSPIPSRLVGIGVLIWLEGK